MLDFRNHSKSGVKPVELVGWDSSVDPRYTDFGEVEFSALHLTIQKRCEIGVELDLFRLVNNLRHWQ